MHLIRLFVFSLLTLLLLVLGISFFIPSEIRLSKAVNVMAADSAIWQPIQDIREWPSWNPFFKDVSPDSLGLSDAAGGPLRTVELKGTTIRLQKNGETEWQASMERPSRKPVVNGWHIVRHASSDSATIQWYMDFKLRWYPWEKFSSLLFERTYGPGMEMGLNNLRAIISAGNRTSNK
ncbi:MAG: SRPBCC family protein [Sphingobacteriales bacterium]|nr:SRPBCC family protein [Sphingobacteriales bacterium]OJW33649.1 MAG: hypothetical protein BGO54_10435 [Sphingobacteriales bacterium 46-32]